MLGPLIRETKLKYVYHRRASPAYIPKRLAHVEPCRSCPDHPHPNRASTRIVAVIDELHADEI